MSFSNSTITSFAFQTTIVRCKPKVGFARYSLVYIELQTRGELAWHTIKTWNLMDNNSSKMMKSLFAKVICGLNFKLCCKRRNFATKCNSVVLKNDDNKFPEIYLTLLNSKAKLKLALFTCLLATKFVV